MRVGFFLLLFWPLLDSASQLPSAGREVYVLNSAPASLVSLDVELRQQTGQTPLSASLAAITLDPTRRFLFVLVNGSTNLDGKFPNRRGEILICDRAARTIVRRLAAGWSPSTLAFTHDQRYLVCYRGRPAGRTFDGGISSASAALSIVRAKKLARQPSAISIIDVSTNEIAARVELDKAESQVLFSSTTGRFCVSGGSGPVKLITVGGSIQHVPIPGSTSHRHMALSLDGEWLYLAEDGIGANETHASRKGRVYVIEVARAQLAQSFELGSAKVLFDLGMRSDGIAVMAEQSGELWQFSGRELLLRIEAGSGSRFISSAAGHGTLIVDKDVLGHVEAGGSALDWTIAWGKALQGQPGTEVLALPEIDRIVVPVITSRQGMVDLDKVALVDSVSHRLIVVVPTGRRTRMSLKTAGISLADALSGSSSMDRRGLYQPVPRSLGWNGFDLEVLEINQDQLGRALAVSEDRKFLYALTRYTNDVTVVNTADGSVVDKIPVGGGSIGIVRPKGSRYLCVWGPEHLTWIDTETNRIFRDDRPCHSKFRRLQVDPKQRRIITFTDECVTFWAAETGVRLATFDKLRKPRLAFGAARPN